MRRGQRPCSRRAGQRRPAIASAFASGRTGRPLPSFAVRRGDQGRLSGSSFTRHRPARWQQGCGGSGGGRSVDTTSLPTHRSSRRRSPADWAWHAGALRCSCPSPPCGRRIVDALSCPAPMPSEEMASALLAGPASRECGPFPGAVVQVGNGSAISNRRLAMRGRRRPRRRGCASGGAGAAAELSAAARVAAATAPARCGVRSAGRHDRAAGQDGRCRTGTTTRNGRRRGVLFAATGGAPPASAIGANRARDVLDVLLPHIFGAR